MNTFENEKAYATPEVEVIEVNVESAILDSSVIEPDPEF